MGRTSARQRCDSDGASDGEGQIQVEQQPGVRGMCERPLDVYVGADLGVDLRGLELEAACTGAKHMRQRRRRRERRECMAREERGCGSGGDVMISPLAAHAHGVCAALCVCVQCVLLCCCAA